MAKSKEFIESLPNWADKYIDHCIESTKEVATGSGKIVKVRERHLPTIQYFLQIWLPRQAGLTITRETYYEWLKSENELKSDTIKKIDDKFRALARDIVANEGKGIFYAKNYLDMTDRQENKQDMIVKFVDEQSRTNRDTDTTRGAEQSS
jgi:hypothetical protein